MKNSESMLLLDALLSSLMLLLSFTPFQEACFNLAPLIYTCNGILYQPLEWIDAVMASESIAVF